jgi:hypothetical protein
VKYDSELSASRNILSTGHTTLGYVVVLSSAPPELQAELIFRGLMFCAQDTAGIFHERPDKERMVTGIFSVIRNNVALLSVGVPEKVRIFGQDWSVIWEAKHYDFSGRKANCDNTIHLNESYSGVEAWQILWHEILHAIYDKLELEVSEQADERDIETMSFLLCLLFTQNDFSWLLEGGDDS